MGVNTNLPNATLDNVLVVASAVCLGAVAVGAVGLVNKDKGGLLMRERVIRIRCAETQIGRPFWEGTESWLLFGVFMRGLDEEL